MTQPKFKFNDSIRLMTQPKLQLNDLIRLMTQPKFQLNDLIRLMTLPISLIKCDLTQPKIQLSNSKMSRGLMTQWFCEII